LDPFHYFCRNIFNTSSSSSYYTLLFFLMPSTAAGTHLLLSKYIYLGPVKMPYPSVREQTSPYLFIREFRMRVLYEMCVVGNNVCSYFFFLCTILEYLYLSTFNHRCRAEKKSRVLRAHAHHTHKLYNYINYNIWWCSRDGWVIFCNVSKAHGASPGGGEQDGALARILNLFSKLYL